MLKREVLLEAAKRLDEAEEALMGVNGLWERASDATYDEIREVNTKWSHAEARLSKIMHMVHAVSDEETEQAVQDFVAMAYAIARILGAFAFDIGGKKTASQLPKLPDGTLDELRNRLDAAKAAVRKSWAWMLSRSVSMLEGFSQLGFCSSPCFDSSATSLAFFSSSAGSSPAARRSASSSCFITRSSTPTSTLSVKIPRYFPNSS